MTSALDTDALYRRCDPQVFDFETTAELRGREDMVGQQRALSALDFGTSIRQPGYNVFVLGSRGAGKHAAVRRVLDERAAAQESPPDWCYLHNFDDPSRPRLLSLPAGYGKRLRDDLERLIEELLNTIPATFESEEYQARLQEIQQDLQQQQEQAFSEIRDEAQSRNVALMQTPSGFTFAPLENGEVMDPQHFQQLDQAERERWQKEIQDLQEQLGKVLRKAPQWQKEHRKRAHELNQEMAELTVGPSIRELEERYDRWPEVQGHLSAIKEDITGNVDAFRSQEMHAGQSRQSWRRMAVAREEGIQAMLNRYRINVLVDNSECAGAPVVYADLPTFQHLVGREEHYASHGALFTDFTLLRPGVLHRANGGYLILDARKILMQPLAWEGLKRALFSGEVRIESLERMFSLMTTVSLEPEPMPLDLKVVLIGDRLLYYLLSAHDPDFAALFKVQADFEDDLPRDDESVPLYARFIASLADDAELPPLDRGGVARVVEHASRMVDDSERLSARATQIQDLLREAGYWARHENAGVIASTHVQAAIDQREYRAERVRDQIYRMIERESLLIDTENAVVGQINGLAVFQLNSFRFGRPSRITANVWLGRGRVIDIERETELGGAIHSKGVLILSSFLGARFATERDLSLSASLTFEQSYGPVEGDSASVAELCALLSALGKIPIRQSFAVTGSVNQHGRVQAIGGVNEKIEGFFDICQRRGLTGDQGVVIPQSNVSDLMLRADVREAAAAGKFHIYPVADIDEAIGLLTGMAPGELDEHGAFPENTVNRAVADRLATFAERHRANRDDGSKGDRGG